MRKKWKRIFLFVAAAVVLSALLSAAYRKYASPTRIAFVNYPEYILAQEMDQKLNSSIEVTALKWTEESGDELRDYDMILFFGMGLALTERQQEILDKLEKPLYVTASTRVETALNTLTGEQKEQLVAYLRNGGRENFRRMLNFVRREIDGKILWADPVEPPQVVPRVVFFHEDESKGFETYGEYLEFYRKSGKYRPGAQTVLIFSGNGGGDLPALVAALEKRKINVVAANRGPKLLELLETVRPDLIVYQPHGRFAGGDEKILNFLRDNNVPLLCPVKAEQPYEEWLKDQRGMDGALLSQSVTMPELDGGTVPFALSALFRDERGLLAFRAIPDRLERFADLVGKMLELQRKANADKKVAIVYYKGPGKNALTAGGLEVGESLLNTLRGLRKAGFNTGDLPESAEELIRQIQENAAVFGSYAEGAMQDFMKRAKTVKISGADYADWVSRSMPADLYQTVVDQYGAFPGRYFATPDGGMLLGMLRFGNIVLMPQALSGEGGDTSKVIHGVKMAPPHTYIATYLWIRHGFKADALIHFGTHGSLEFTPWKQVVLSSYDWPDVLIGEIPHFYLYMMNDMGEAQIAKRRSYATMISHLTAPYMNSELYGPIRELDDKLEKFLEIEDPGLKAEYERSVIELAKRDKFDHELKFTADFAAGKLNETDAELLHNHLHAIGGEKINRGLYVIGRPYTKAEATETAKLMMIDTVAEELFKADVAAGRVEERGNADEHFYQANYLKPAGEKIDRVFAGIDDGSIRIPERGPAVSVGTPEAPAGNAQEEIRRMMSSGKLPDGRPIPPAMAAMLSRGGTPPPEIGMSVAPAGERKMEQLPPEFLAVEARENLLRSTELEIAGLVRALSGSYLPATSGGDPIGNPDNVPTGRNMYGIDPERTPTRESFALGRKLAEALIEAKLKSTGEYPRKVSFTVWGGEFINTYGSDIGEIFWLLGVEPIWDSRGRVRDVRLIPSEELKRPRIDVIVQTSVQFRGAAASRMLLIDKAVRLAAADKATRFANYVLEGSEAAVKALVSGGMSPEEARTFAHARLFGGGNGEDNGPGVGGLTRAGDKWDDPAVIAEAFLRSRGTLYTADHWGINVPGVYKAAMSNTDTVVQSRSSNLWGPLSLDHVYEFTGGANIAAKYVTGEEPEVYFNDLRIKGRPKMQTAAEALMLEARTTVLNPKYIKEMMEEGPTGAGTFAAFFSNTYGWEVTKPDVIQDYLWEEYKKVYIDDELDLGMRDYFEKKNPYALQEMTAVMLETIRKGYWKADEDTIRQLVDLHVELVEKFDPGCSGFVCNNAKLREMIAGKLSDPELRREYQEKIEEVRTPKVESREEVSGQTLREEKIQPDESKLVKRAPGIALIALGVIVLIGVVSLVIGSVRGRRSQE